MVKLWRQQGLAPNKPLQFLEGNVISWLPGQCLTSASDLRGPVHFLFRPCTQLPLEGQRDDYVHTEQNSGGSLQSLKTFNLKEVPLNPQHIKLFYRHFSSVFPDDSF